MALGRTEPRRTHGTPPAVCPGLAAPATTSPARTRSRPPTAVPGSRPPLRHRNGSWPDGAAPYPRHATRGVSRPRGPHYNIAGAHPEQATHGGSGLAAPVPTEYDTATSTSVAHRARMGGADDAVRPGGQERRGDRRLGHGPVAGRRRRVTPPDHL